MQKSPYLNLLIIIVVSVVIWLAFFSIIKAANWALEFDGVNDYFLVPDSASLDVTEAISIEFWAKVDETQNSMYVSLLAKEDAYDIGYYQDTGKIWFELYLGTYVWLDSVGTINDGAWHHIVGTYDKEKMKIYIDGGLDNESSQTASISTSVYPLALGAWKNSSFTYFFNGLIDEPRIYSRTLSATEVGQHYGGTFSNETGLVGLWHFDEGTGLASSDSSGQGNNGSIGGAAWVAGVAAGGTITGTEGIENASPKVELKTHFKGTYRDKVSVSYSASDSDTPPGGLKAQPIDIFYSVDRGYKWQKIAEKQSNTGEYIFDTTQVSDGTDYKIRIVALDGYDYPGNADSEVFSIDNTVPTFDISILPSSLVREKDTIELKIISSEELKIVPELKIIHEEREAKAIIVSGSQKEFSAVYDVARGPGKAVISITGEDLVGNIGKTISSGESFLVERYGPPPPSLEQLVNNQIFSQPNISVVGISQPGTEIVLTLNEVTKFTTRSSIDGSFRIDDINLNSDNYGYNALSIIAFNEKREDSEEILLNLKLNSAPEILSTSISQGETFSAEKEINWTISDLNNDELIFSIEYSNDQGTTWDFIVSDYSINSYLMDTTQLADGSNYFLRLTADDGTAKISETFKNITFKNNLPHISLDIPSKYFTNINTPILTGKITGSEENILLAEYSLDKGITWRSANALDGNFNSLIEEIEIAIPESLEDGKYAILIKAIDILNRSVKISRSFNIDTIPPVTEVPLLDKVVEDSMDSNLEIEGLQVSLLGMTEAEAKIKLVLENKTYEASANEKGEFEISNVVLPFHGSNKFSLLSSDLAGNTSQIDGVAISNNLPEISNLNLKENEFLGDTKQISWQAEDMDNDLIVSQILYQERGEKWISLFRDSRSNIYNWDLSKLVNGEYKIKIIVSDGMSEIEEIVNVFIDNIAPQVVFGVAGPSLTTNNQPLFSGQAIDDLSGIEYVEYSFNNTDWYKTLFLRGYQTKKAVFRFQHQPPLADGDYKVKLRITDRAGNIAYSEPLNLTINAFPPRVGSYLISSGALILFPDEQGFIRLFKDTPYKILASVSKDTKEAILRVKETSFDFNFNRATLLWESEFNFKESGEYPVFINAQDGMGNSQTKEIANLKVIPQGIIYDKETNLPIGGAKAVLFVFDQSTNSWLVWDGQAFDQKNPQNTGVTGEYGFLVPPGKYRLEVSKPGFKTVKSQELEIKNNYLINIDIHLAEKKGILNEILDYLIKMFGF